MASNALLLAIFAVVSAAAASGVAKQIVVGDDNGWKLNFDYKSWAAGKEFYVGDTLVFNYKQGAHNVIKVNQTQFANCNVSDTAAPLASGNDIITLAASGKKWYVCGVADHCSKGGMKLVIDVLPQVDAPAAAPAPSVASAATNIAPSKFLPWMIAAAMAFFFVIMA